MSYYTTCTTSTTYASSVYTTYTSTYTSSLTTVTPPPVTSTYTTTTCFPSYTTYYTYLPPYYTSSSAYTTSTISGYPSCTSRYVTTTISGMVMLKNIQLLDQGWPFPYRLSIYYLYNCSNHDLLCYNGSYLLPHNNLFYDPGELSCPLIVSCHSLIFQSYHSTHRLVTIQARPRWAILWLLLCC